MLARTKVISQFLQDKIGRKIDVVIITSNLLQSFELHLSDSKIIEISEIPSFTNTKELHITSGIINQLSILLVPIDISYNNENKPLWDGICNFFKDEILFIDNNIEDKCSQAKLIKAKEILSSEPTIIPFRGLNSPHADLSFNKGNIPMKEVLLTNLDLLIHKTENYRTINKNIITLLNNILWKHKKLGCFILEIPNTRADQISDFCKYLLTCITSYM